MNNEKIARLHFITLDDYRTPPARQVLLACQAGIKWVQLRIKEGSRAFILQAAREARGICDHYQARLIINDHPDIALQCGADGVHLGQQDMPVAKARKMAGKLIIGGTANTPAQALDMARQGADYIGAGPFRFTTTKKKLSPILGRKGIEAIRDQLDREGMPQPLIAVGGIRIEDLEELLALRIYGIAVSGTIARAADPLEVTKKLENYFTKLKSDVGNSW
ncbi:thiamine-phosphate diphosphorylase [Anseongella ginsenosidimutans]|uniref:Thiamine-phosphate synthase n=1 Tax=Anseongella ginsenosidimutans TaxID=496056 RepID=A0A4R3KPY5_9SPHI|nr:thiamine phosphate synthase [Anseongella ginsenosidimutans]QEC53748.1 thiamine phosphate synthase [Anseongella ginsenosidimutans]TCS85996.1 thiamine-phosphate diphosphorylase [Anseongella ginsenosidimutans]